MTWSIYDDSNQQPVKATDTPATSQSACAQACKATPYNGCVFYRYDPAASKCQLILENDLTTYCLKQSQSDAYVTYSEKHGEAIQPGMGGSKCPF